MNCPICGLEAIIKGSRIEVTGDKSVKTQTEVAEVMEYMCRNRRCEKNGTVIGEDRIKIYPKGGEGDE